MRKLNVRLLAPAWVLAIAGTSARCRTTEPPHTVVYGEWRVSGSRCPAASCEAAEALVTAWHGRGAQYNETRAQFADNSCGKPTYRVDYWPAAGIYGGVRLADLGITAGSVMVVDILCAKPDAKEDEWEAGPGAFLIVSDPAHLLVVWKGMYFALDKEER